MKNHPYLTWILALIMIGSSASTGTVRKAKNYTDLIIENTQVLASSMGVKSVLFNPEGTKLYALNLEAGSIYEFNQAKKSISKEIRFLHTKAQGMDYERHRSIPSFAEKPVEACFVEKMLWVSLHNAAGIIPLFPDSIALNKMIPKYPTIKAIVIDREKQSKDTISIPLINTGKTPKVIAKTGAQTHLLVSNWTSKNVSLLKLNDSVPPFGKRIASFPMSATPRGIAIDNKNNKSYIAIMGGNKITVINNKTWKVERSFVVPENPRHLVTDTLGRLYVSFNAGARLACIDARTGKILFSAKTGLQPRTIALSRNQKFLFVTCYGGNSVEVYKIRPRGFSKVYTLNCPGKPVGIALYENETQLEAWVGNYMSGTLRIFTFKKVY